MQIQDKCSFEWAKKLKAAGFTPPEKRQVGEVWYDKFGRPIIISCVLPSGMMDTMNAKTFQGARVIQLREAECYAPGVTELITQVSFNGNYSPEIHYSIECKDFRCLCDGEGSMKVTKSNICDTLAEAWIENRKDVPV